MAELEKEELDTIPEETIPEETNTETDSDITYEQAMEWKDKANRLDKAEKTVVKYKKQLKETKTDDGVDTSKYITKEEAALDKFLDNNVDLVDYKEDISKYVKGGLSLKQAKILVENDDKTIINRKKSNSLNITDGEVSGKTTYTVAELEKLGSTEYNKVRGLMDSGKVTLRT